MQPFCLHFGLLVVDWCDVEMAHDAQTATGFRRSMFGHGQIIQKLVNSAMGRTVWVGSSCRRACGATNLRERKKRGTSREHSNTHNAIEVYLNTGYACMRMCNISPLPSSCITSALSLPALRRSYSSSSRSRTYRPARGVARAVVLSFPPLRTI